MFWKRKKSKFDEPQNEPLFTAIHRDDAAMHFAYSQAAQSLVSFISHIERPGEHTCAAKLRFKDPDASAELGEDRFVFLWLSAVSYEAATQQFDGTFFELPPELLKWHHVGQRLRFEGEDIFDWFVNDNGHLYGGFTLRVARSRMPEAERAAFDSYAGIRYWVEASRQ